MRPASSSRAAFSRPAAILGIALGICLAAGLAVPACAAAAEVPITFRVRVPASTPDGAGIWISGGMSALGSWNGRGLLLERREEGWYAGTVGAAPETFLEYKATRGGWETVEKSKEGREIPNRSLVVTAAETLTVLVEAWRDQVVEKPRESTLTGTIRLHPGMASRHLPRSRDVRVWLPPGYDEEPERRYPVLYMHDGQNVFDAATAFIGLEWRADETATRLIEREEMEPIIIVAVSNSADRETEYAPPASSRMGSGGDAYGRFLVEELKPFVDRTYRTRPDAASTGLMGSSLGGLITLYLGLEHPEVFTRLGVVSPPVFWDDGAILARVAAAARPRARIWLDIGTLEGVTPEEHTRWRDGARALRDALLALGFVEGRDLAYLEDEGAVHNEAAWAGRLDRALRFLFPPGD